MPRIRVLITGIAPPITARATARPRARGRRTILSAAHLGFRRQDETRNGMIWVPGGTFRMGSDKHYPEEAPAHRVTVDGFWMDRERSLKKIVFQRQLANLRVQRLPVDGRMCRSDAAPWTKTSAAPPSSGAFHDVI